MKYWMRMMARVGLLLTVLLWWFSQSTLVAVNGPFIGVGVMGIGWVIGWHGEAGSPHVRLTNEVLLDPSQFHEDFLEVYEIQTLVMPGVQLRRFAPNHILLVDHWLLCLTFLIATVVTSVRWRRKPKSAQQDEASATEGSA